MGRVSELTRYRIKLFLVPELGRYTEPGTPETAIITASSPEQALSTVLINILGVPKYVYTKCRDDGLIDDIVKPEKTFDPKDLYVDFLTQHYLNRDLGNRRAFKPEEIESFYKRHRISGKPGSKKTRSQIKKDLRQRLSHYKLRVLRYIIERENLQEKFEAYKQKVRGEKPEDGIELIGDAGPMQPAPAPADEGPFQDHKPRMRPNRWRNARRPRKQTPAGQLLLF